jgi:hypothetical protein
MQVRCFPVFNFPHGRITLGTKANTPPTSKGNDFFLIQLFFFFFKELCDLVSAEVTILRGECMYGLTCPRCDNPVFDNTLPSQIEENLTGVTPLDMDALRSAGYTGEDELIFYDNEIYVVVGENTYERTCVGYNPVGTKW